MDTPALYSDVLQCSSDTLSISTVKKIVQKTVDDVSRRQRNVIVSGIKESHNLAVSDTNVLIEVCEQYLHLFVWDKMMFVKRLGSQPKNSDVPRRLLVVLDSEQLAGEMLFRAHQLRDSTDFSIAEKMLTNLKTNELHMSVGRPEDASAPPTTSSLSGGRIFHQSSAQEASRGWHHSRHQTPQ